MQFGFNMGILIIFVIGVLIIVLNVQIGGYDFNGGYWLFFLIFDLGGNYGMFLVVIFGMGQIIGYVLLGMVILILIYDNQMLLYQYMIIVSNSLVVMVDF